MSTDRTRTGAKLVRLDLDLLDDENRSLRIVHTDCTVEDARRYLREALDRLAQIPQPFTPDYDVSDQLCTPNDCRCGS